MAILVSGTALARRKSTIAKPQPKNLFNKTRKFAKAIRSSLKGIERSQVVSAEME